MALGEGRVVQPEVAARDDERYLLLPFLPVPVAGLEVEEAVGDGLEEHVGREPTAERAAETEACRDLELRGGEAPQGGDEGLLLEVGDLLGAEAIVPRAEEARGDLLGDDEVVGAHQAVLGRERRQGVAVEL